MGYYVDAATRKKTLRVPCPSCKAPVGAPCRTQWGALAALPHKPRLTAAPERLDNEQPNLRLPATQPAWLSALCALGPELDRANAQHLARVLEQQPRPPEPPQPRTPYIDRMTPSSPGSIYSNCWYCRHTHGGRVLSNPCTDCGCLVYRGLYFHAAGGEGVEVEHIGQQVRQVGSLRTAVPEAALVEAHRFFCPDCHVIHVCVDFVEDTAGVYRWYDCIRRECGEYGTFTPHGGEEVIVFDGALARWVTKAV